MQIRRLTTAAELAPLKDRWNALAGGIPFRRHEWLAAWWRHYGVDGDLYTLLVEDNGAILGIAPFYLQRSAAGGRVLRLLGDGEVCSDYVGLLTDAVRQDEVVATVSEWLTSTAGDRDHGWDALRLDGLDAHDTATVRLVQALRGGNCLIDQRTGPNCWRLELPVDWPAYEATLSKSHRKNVRRLIDRVLKRGRASLHTVVDASQFEQGRQILINLHQRRRQMLGEPGRFSSPAFAAFHAEVMQSLLAARVLRLQWLELDGVPAAAEYNLAEGGVIYGYQSGVAPELLHEEPGRLSAIAVLRAAVEEGSTAFDFLRGDEPYKAHFRAQPRPLAQYRIAPPRASARLRHQAWSAGRRMKEWWRTQREDRETGQRMDTAAAQHQGSVMPTTDY